MNSTPSIEKLQELILYVAKRCYDDPFYGATKLNKILFFSDFLAFRKRGHSITSCIYRKREYGPALSDFKEIRETMVRSGVAARQQTELAGHRQDRIVHLRDPNLDLFAAEEIAIVDEMIDLLRHKSAAEVSEFSHKFVGWQMARMGEEIPYETLYISKREPSEKEKAHALTLEPSLKNAVE